MHFRRKVSPEQEPQRDPNATQIWRAGLGHIKAGEPVIRAPHAADLVPPVVANATDRRDAA
jgi:hypothetical protein